MFCHGEVDDSLQATVCSNCANIKSTPLMVADQSAGYLLPPLNWAEFITQVLWYLCTSAITGPCTVYSTQCSTVQYSTLQYNTVHMEDLGVKTCKMPPSSESRIL